MQKNKLIIFSLLALCSLVATAQPVASTSASAAQKIGPKVALKNLPFPKLKESLLEYSTRRIEDLTKEKACIESAKDNKEIRACVALIKANHQKTTEAVNTIASKNP